MVAGNTASVNNTASFEYELSYSRVGVYKYTLTEKIGAAGGVTYSNEVYNIEVTVSDDTDNDGMLNAAVKVNGVIVSAENIADTLVFKNIYEVALSAAKITAKKNLSGRVLADGEFEFELYDANKTLLETAKNKADGSVQFSPVAIDAEGEYVFYVKEKAGTAEHVTYDGKDYKVTVTATDNGEGEYTLVYKYEQDTALVEDIVFENIYIPPTPPTPPAPPAPPTPGNPQTGDGSNLNLWLALLFVSGGVLAATFLRKKRVTEN
jgi:pilin isopeptide linkage protein/LPXTG-motif cell wall-anchored protein